MGSGGAAPGAGIGQVAFDFDLDDGGTTYGVAELAAELNGLLERRFSEGIWVRGEIQGWSKASSGHIYFDLVERDDSGAVATLKVAFFAGQQRGPRERLRRAGLKLGAGLRVRIYGFLGFHAERGTLSLKMTDIDPRFTLGELALQREDIVRRLIADGRYAANRERRLPLVPLRVGVVSSVGSAAWHDFSTELARSGLAFRLEVVDVRVQGRDAVPMICAAIARLAGHDLDVIALIRGGGAKGDLAAFDAEEVAVAIADCALPVFTGLGHETDRSVADEVAHRATKTPTACAVELVQRVEAFRQRADDAWRAIAAVAQGASTVAAGRLATLGNGIRQHSVGAVARGDERLGHRAARMRACADRELHRAAQLVDAAVAGVGRAPRQVDAETRHLDSLAARARLLDPASTMARGWSITRDATGRAVRDAAVLSPGDVLTTTFAKGWATSRVEDTDG